MLSRLTQDKYRRAPTGVEFPEKNGSGTLKAVRNGADVEITLRGNAGQVGEYWYCRAGSDRSCLRLPTLRFLVGGAADLFCPTTVLSHAWHGCQRSQTARPFTFPDGDGSCCGRFKPAECPVSRDAALDFAFVDIHQSTTIEQQSFLAVLGPARYPSICSNCRGGPDRLFAAGFEWRAC